MDTIFALATARGKAGVAVIRMSGPKAFDVGSDLCGPLPATRMVGLRRVSAKPYGEIDEALVVKFDEGHSFTGEPVVELHLHGSTAVVSATLQALSAFDDLRLAEPGEFTRRALDNNRLDLTQVEGLADLIEAETEAQRRQAQRVLQGELGRKVETWRSRLIRAAALIEATIDFADEDVPVDVSVEVLTLIEEVQRDLNSEINGYQASERIRDGFEVAIVGPPNVGKSTLLNALAGREAAITSEIAGTTRDVIEVRMDIGGLPVTFLDTAGLRETLDQVEAIGVERGRQRAASADLRVNLVPMQDWRDHTPNENDIYRLAKGDLYASSVGAVSGLTLAGLDDLMQEIRCRLESRVSQSSVAIRERHRIAIEGGLSYLASARAALFDEGVGLELVAEELRSVVRELETVMGRVGVEALLSEIFSSFCLGK